MLSGAQHEASSSDNRRHLRVASGLRCWCEGDNVTFYARVGNLGEGGLFLRTNTPLPRGARVLLRLQRTGEPEVTATATVVWVRYAQPQQAPAGMGLEFEPLDSVTQERLRRIISLEQKAHRTGGE